MRLGGTVNGHTLFHPDSFIPRSMDFNLTTHMFGFSVNAFEVRARMEGIERLLGKYMQDGGYLSSEYLNKIFKIPNRQRRNVNTESLFDDIDEQVMIHLISFRGRFENKRLLLQDILDFLHLRIQNFMTFIMIHYD